MGAKWDGKIPFDAYGNQMAYPDGMTGGYMDIETGEAFICGIHYNVGKYGTEGHKSYLTDEIRKKMKRRTCRMHPVIWRDNCVFEDTLQYVGYSRGRSAADMCFKSVSTGAEYNMFLSDFDDVMERYGLDRDRVTAQWTFVKRGQNFGIKLAK